MGGAIETGQREQLIALKKQGKPLATISQELNLPLSTVKTLSARYSKTGNLTLASANCGSKQPTNQDILFR